MKVKAVIDFRDRENGLKLREKGAVFDVNEKRAEKLLNFGYVVKVKESTKPERGTQNEQI